MLSTNSSTSVDNFRARMWESRKKNYKSASWRLRQFVIVREARRMRLVDKSCGQREDDVKRIKTSLSKAGRVINRFLWRNGGFTYKYPQNAQSCPLFSAGDEMSGGGDVVSIRTNIAFN